MSENGIILVFFGGARPGNTSYLTWKKSKKKENGLSSAPPSLEKWLYPECSFILKGNKEKQLYSGPLANGVSGCGTCSQLSTPGRTCSQLVSLAYTWSHLFMQATPGDTWPHLVTHGHTWSHMATIGHTWPHLVIPGHTWSRLVTHTTPGRT